MTAPEEQTQDQPFDSIEKAIADIRDGKMVIVTDDAARENEGDIICAASKVTPEIVNFMATHARGMICVPVTEKRAAALGLKPMVQDNRETFATDFTVTVDAASGITTGISTADRAKTISILANPRSLPEDLVQPGHINPLQAKPGGVLRRAGHTEAAVDLASLAGHEPAGVICEVLNEDGSMARLPQLKVFAEKHGLSICCIEDLIQYRRKREKLVKCEEVVKLPTEHGEFNLHMFRTSIDGQIHLALVKGEIKAEEPTLVRVHSECLTGDVFASRRCDCGGQLTSAMRAIESAGNGVLLYMRQEGRGIGLAAKLHAYRLQEDGLDTVEANEKLGYPADLRDYGMGAQILFDLGVRKIRLLTNNPRKVVGLSAHNLEIVEQVRIQLDPNDDNRRYLETKKVKLGHFL